MARTQKNKATNAHLGLLKAGDQVRSSVRTRKCVACRPSLQSFGRRSCPRARKVAGEAEDSRASRRGAGAGAARSSAEQRLKLRGLQDRRCSSWPHRLPIRALATRAWRKAKHSSSAGIYVHKGPSALSDGCRSHVVSNAWSCHIYLNPASTPRQPNVSLSGPVCLPVCTCLFSTEFWRVHVRPPTEHVYSSSMWPSRGWQVDIAEQDDRKRQRGLELRDELVQFVRFVLARLPPMSSPL